MNRLKKMIFISLVALMASTYVMPLLCYAESGSLDEVGAVTQQAAQSTTQESTSSMDDILKIDDSKVSDSNRESAEAVSELFSIGGVTEESVQKSKKWVEPIAKVINLFVAVLLGLLSVGVMAVSVLDLVYIQIPATRSFLNPNQSSAPTPAMPGMIGTPGVQGAPGMGGMGGVSSMAGGNSLSSHRWVSDEAVAAISEGAPSPAMPGMPAFAAAKPGGKSVIVSYLKKRAFTLIMLGVCVVLFTCTIFTDIGVLISMKIVGLLSGVTV